MVQKMVIKSNRIVLAIIFVLIFFIIIYVFISSKSSKQMIVIAELKEDLSNNYLNYIDKPSWLTSQALRLVIPPLIDYEGNCYPYSKILNQIPSKDNKMMFQQNRQTIMIIRKNTIQGQLINPINIIPTIHLLNMQNISNKWIHRNILESVEQIDQIDSEDLRIKYKIAYSLPYFPSPIIFDNIEKYQQQILDYTYKDMKNFSFFPAYSKYEVKKSETNHFVLTSKTKNLEIHFLTYTNIEKLKREIGKIDVLKIPSSLEEYITKYINQEEYKTVRLPRKETYFIFFNPNISKNERIFIYQKLKSELQKYNIKEYQIINSYILPYHFAAIEKFNDENNSNIIPTSLSKKLNVILTYKDQKSKLLSNLMDEIIKNSFNAEVIIVNLEEKLPRKEIFGILVEPPEPSLKDDINPYNFDFIITSITMLPYMNYYFLYSKSGKYNVYSVSTPEIEQVLEKIMDGFSFDQKNYLIELQQMLFEQFLIVPILIDTQTFIIKKDKDIKINPINLEID